MDPPNAMEKLRGFSHCLKNKNCNYNKYLQEIQVTVCLPLSDARNAKLPVSSLHFMQNIY